MVMSSEDKETNTKLQGYKNFLKSLFFLSSEKLCNIEYTCFKLNGSVYTNAFNSFSLHIFLCIKHDILIFSFTVKQ